MLAQGVAGGDEIIDEATAPSGRGPAQMVQVCLAWEAAFAAATAGVDRTVLLRMGIGLGGTGDSATERLAWLVRRGLGGTVGSGRQWVSWVALEDLLEVMLRAIDDETMAGLWHVTSPNPVTNAEMMATYRELLVGASACLRPFRSPTLGPHCSARTRRWRSRGDAASPPGCSAKASSSPCSPSAKPPPVP